MPAIIAIPLTFGLISLVAGFLRKQRVIASSRNYFIRRFVELNDDILRYPGRVGFLAFFFALLYLFYITVLKNPPP
jgi:hypothetical protein